MSDSTTIPRLLGILGVLVAAMPPAAAADAIDVTRAGVVGDGTTLNTAAIQRAIDGCAAAGGGVVAFPAGRYLTGTIRVKSRVTLRLDERATLLGSTDAADYPAAAGDDAGGRALVVAADVEHVGIEGKGTIDGQGPALKARQTPYKVRPFLVRWERCRDIVVRDVRLVNPGQWGLVVSRSTGILIEGVTIRSRGVGVDNNDGIDIDSSEDVRVRGCDVDSGDDALVVKSTGRRPTRNLVVSGCTLSSHANAFKLGTESVGGFENVRVSDCRVVNTDLAGIALHAVDGGDLTDVRIDGVTMDGVGAAISVRLGARLKTFRRGDPPNPAAGRLRDVTIRNVTAANVKDIGVLVNGVPDHPVEALTLAHVRIEVPGGGTADDAKVRLPEKEAAYPEYRMFGKTFPAYGVYARHVRGLTLEDVRTTARKPDARPATVFIDVEGAGGDSLPARARGD